MATYTPLPPGHDSAEHAYVIEDWPWGFKLRTTKRFWIERTKNGARVVSQTVDPRTGRDCKPKKSTYDAVRVLVLDEDGKIQNLGLSAYAELDKVQEFADAYDAGLNNVDRQVIAYMIRIGKKREAIRATREAHAAKLPSSGATGRTIQGTEW